MTLLEFCERIEGMTRSDDINAVCEESGWQFTTGFYIDGSVPRLGESYPLVIHGNRYLAVQIDGNRIIYEKRS